MFIIHKI